MTSRKNPDKTLSLADFDHSQISFGHSVLNGLSVLENFRFEEGKNLKSDFRSTFMSIFLVKEGKANLNLNMESHPVRENSLFHISPNTIVGQTSGSVTVSGISFSSDFLSEIGTPERSSELFTYFSSKYHPIWQLEADDGAVVSAQVSHLVDRLTKYSTHPFGKEILISAFYIFLFEIGALGQKYSEMTRMNFSRQESLVIRFGNLARKNFREERTVKVYADQLNVSAKYLTEVVKEYSGKNASEIINDLVILEAKFLLSRTQLSIGEIAAKLHFSDQSFFGKYFKRQTGVSPKSFRESALI
jgi:AraC family transcriptional activator of pobA